MAYDPDFDDVPPQGGRQQHKEDKSVPDGVYDATVTDVSYFVDKSGTKRESWWFRIVGGPYDGSEVQLFNSINRRNAGRAKGRFIMVARTPRADVSWGELYDAERRTSPPHVRQECVGATVRIRKKSTRGRDITFVDIYINARLSPAPDPDARRAAAEHDQQRREAEELHDEPVEGDDDGGWSTDNGASPSGWAEEDIPF